MRRTLVRVLENEADRKAIEDIFKRIDGATNFQVNPKLLSDYQLAHTPIQLDQVDVILSEIKVNIKMFTRTATDHPFANAA